MVKDTTESPQVQAVTPHVAELAAKVGANVDIYDICLVHQEAEMREIIKEAPKLRRLLRKHQFVRDDDSEMLRVDVIFLFELAEDTEASKKHPPVTIGATFALSYTVLKLSEFQDDEVSAFAKVNGAYNAWPFWREFVYSTMSRMGLPPITLPVFRIVEVEDSDVLKNA